jgi:hypothetical protein
MKLAGVQDLLRVQGNYKQGVLFLLSYCKASQVGSLSGIIRTEYATSP